jgi:hypothetical protein
MWKHAQIRTKTGAVAIYSSHHPRITGKKALVVKHLNHASVDVECRSVRSFSSKNRRAECLEAEDGIPGPGKKLGRPSRPKQLLISEQVAIDWMTVCDAGKSLLPISIVS